MADRDVVIVGAGPAGMAAAIPLCAAGLKPTIIDENPKSGGQIYRQPPKAFRPHASATISGIAERGIELRRAFHRCDGQMELLTNSTVWGIFKRKCCVMWE